MEFKINRETIPASEVIYNGVQEQSVETDYILPDYYPDIFRLVRCELSPVITGYSIIGDKLSYELRCDIRILYCGENGSVLQSVEQRQSFSKSVELGKNVASPEVNIVPKTDHVNFRALNKRRIDMRGSVSVRISVIGETSQEVLSDAFGMNIQLKKTPVEYAAKKMYARAKADKCEYKLITGKLLAKGDINVNILYSYDTAEGGAVEPMSFTLGFSQIVDMEGVDDSFECNITPEVISCDLSPVPDKNGDNRLIRCEAEIRLICKAVKCSSVMLVTDAFSTVYPCENTYSVVRTELLPTVIHESFHHSAVLASGDNVPDTVYSIWCTPKNINSHIDEDGKSIIISGMLTYSMAAKDDSGTITIPDRDEAFEQRIPVDRIPDNTSVSTDISVGEVSYNISSDGELTVKSDINTDITLSSAGSIRVVTDIAVDDSSRKQRDGDYSIKLYFGVENEDVWDIAKRYSTDVSAVIEENELSGDRLENNGMILIPIVS